jgi:hypothetical protein
MVSVFIATVGVGFTVITPESTAEPQPVVYVTVYVVVVVGDTVIVCVVIPPGAQLYVPPAIDGVAVRLALWLKQMVDEVPTVTVGSGMILTAPVAVAFAQPKIE